MRKFEVGDLVTSTRSDDPRIYEIIDVVIALGEYKDFLYKVFDVDGDNTALFRWESSLRPLSVEKKGTKPVCMPIREKCLTDAQKCVCGDRDQQYGGPENNFTIIADLWTTYLHEHMRDQVCELQPIDVANMMCLFKLGRITTSPDRGTYDSYVDLAGYAACGAEILHDAIGRKEVKENL